MTPPADRMPPLSAEELDEEQAAAVREITSGPRGALVGPFHALLRVPRLMDRVQAVGAYLRYDKQLPDHLFEMAVLMVARQWDQPFEWAHHHPLAVAAGLDPRVVDDLGQDRRPETDEEDVEVVWRVVDQLHRHGGQVDDRTYADATGSLGEAALVELLVTVGYYTTLALVLNVARTPPEAGDQLPPRPRPPATERP